LFEFLKDLFIAYHHPGRDIRYKQFSVVFWRWIEPKDTNQGIKYEKYASFCRSRLFGHNSFCGRLFVIKDETDRCLCANFNKACRCSEATTRGSEGRATGTQATTRSVGRIIKSRRTLTDENLPSNDSVVTSHCRYKTSFCTSRHIERLNLSAFRTRFANAGFP